MAMKSKKAEENMKLLTEKAKFFIHPHGGCGWPPGLHVASGDLRSRVAFGVMGGLRGSRVASGGREWP
jgi:hypothetical protein